VLSKQLALVTILFSLSLVVPATLCEAIDISKKTDEREPQAQSAPPLNLTVTQAMARFGATGRAELKDKFKIAGEKYPPAKISLIGLKQERLLCLFAGDKKQKLIAKFPLSTFSGKLGPKLKEGDLQIPEGVYKITGLRASFRLSLCVDYPNDFDKRQAMADHRTNLGGDILIHNGTKSTGCLVLSMDDMAQIFTAAHDIGCKNLALIIAPCNLTSTKPEMDMSKQPKWLAGLYKKLGQQLNQYKWQ